MQRFRCKQGVLEQCCYGHGSYTTWYGGNPASPFSGRPELHVAAEPPILPAVYADIDDRRIRANPFARNQSAFANGNHQDFGTAHVFFQVDGKAVTAGGGGAGQQQFQHHGAPHVVGGADNNSFLAVVGFAGVIQQSEDTAWCTGPQLRYAQCQAANIVRMKSIDILVRVDPFYDGLGVNVVRQR